MENELFQVAEVELVWKSKVKAADRPKITGSSDAILIFRQLFSEDWIDHHEEFKVMILNRSNKVLGVLNLSKGGITGTVADIRLVLQFAIKGNATSVVICHNHPSGNLQPSEADISITKRVSEALKIFDMNLLDSIILASDDKYYSFADESLL